MLTVSPRSFVFVRGAPVRTFVLTLATGEIFRITRDVPQMQVEWLSHEPGSLGVLVRNGAVVTVGILAAEHERHERCRRAIAACAECAPLLREWTPEEMRRRDDVLAALKGS
jgi:hypothetical protein